jgi:hypothetical protein
MQEFKISTNGKYLFTTDFTKNLMKVSYVSTGLPAERYCKVSHYLSANAITRAEARKIISRYAGKQAQ